MRSQHLALHNNAVCVSIWRRRQPTRDRPRATEANDPHDGAAEIGNPIPQLAGSTDPRLRDFVENTVRRQQDYDGCQMR